MRRPVASRVQATLEMLEKQYANILPPNRVPQPQVSAGASSTAHVTITVLGESPAAANRPPVASDIAIQVHAERFVQDNPCALHRPDPSDTHTFSIGTTGTLGVVVDNGDGTFSYKPGSVFLHLAAGAKASDGFNYTVTDAAGASSTAHVTVTILGESIVAGNRPPVASDIAIKVHEGDGAKTIVARYTDPDVSDTHTISIDTRGTLGIVVDNGDGTFSYTPGAAFRNLAARKASDGFNYTVTDAAGASSTAHVLVTVLGENSGAANRPPVASDIAIQVQVGDPQKRSALATPTLTSATRTVSPSTRPAHLALSSTMATARSATPPVLRSKRFPQAQKPVTASTTPSPMLRAQVRRRMSPSPCGRDPGRSRSAARRLRYFYSGPRQRCGQNDRCKLC